MGKFKGKVLTVFITPSGVRICEGENRNGNPDISKFFVVKGVEEYFSDTGYGRAPEIINLAGLVQAIVDACKDNHTTTRRMMLCSDCFGIETVVDQNSGAGVLKGLASVDVKNIGKSFGGNKREDKAPGRMSCKVDWGELTQDGRVSTVVTRSHGDKYMLKSIVDEFYDKGYEVVCVTGSQEILFNFVMTEQASFDSQGKIILDYDVEMKMAVFYKDIPVSVNTMPMVPREDIMERMLNQIRTALPSTQRNPHIYLTGSVFADPEFYGEAIDILESEGFKVYDLFNRPEVPDNYEELLVKGEIDPVFTADYSANVAMFMASYSSKQLISLTPAVELGDILKRNSEAVARICLGVSCATFAVATVLAAVRGFNIYKMKTDPSSIDSLNQQVANLTLKQQNLNSAIQTLTQADTTVLDLLKFVEANQTDRVAVVSIDTRDVLGDSVSVDSSEVATAPSDPAAVEGDVVTGEAGGPGAVREDIVIRGYARTGNEAVSYYDKLFNLGLAGDPILNGVERYELPDGNEVYVFEIEITGGEF